MSGGEPLSLSGGTRRSKVLAAAAVAISSVFFLASASWAQSREASLLLPTLEEVQRQSPGWFEEVRSEGTSRGSTYRVFQGWHKVDSPPGTEEASVLLNITIRPRPEPPAPWGPVAWREAFEEKQRLLGRIPDLQAKETDVGDFAFIVTKSGGSHSEVTFYTGDLMVTVHNGTEELRLSYPSEAEALKIARWMESRLLRRAQER